MSEIWEIIQGNFVVVLMVLARVSGIFTFNPIFSRNGVPNTIKAGLTLMLAVVMAAAGDFSYTMPQGLLPFVFDIGKELLDRFAEECAEAANLDKPAKLEGRMMSIFLSPKTGK